MRRSVHLPVPKWQMIQVGMAILPRMNAQTTLSYEVAQAVEDLVGGSSFDHFRDRRAPLKMGSFRHTGRYRCCGVPCDCGYSVSEIDMIYQTVGTYVPCLFVRDYTIGQPSRDMCYGTPNCVTFAWAMGKVQKVTNPFSVDDYTSPDEVEATMEGILDDPLREITYSRWRYGYAVSRSLVRNLQALTPATEVAEAEPKAEWYIPCEIPSDCDPERFWPRDLTASHNSGIDLFSTANWDTSQLITLTSPADQLVRVNGNTAPALQILARGDTQIRISNAMGERLFTFPTVASSLVYIDSATGVCLQKSFINEVSPLMGVLDIPALESFENHITIERGWATLGITSQWIN